MQTYILRLIMKQIWPRRALINKHPHIISTQTHTRKDKALISSAQSGLFCRRSPLTLQARGDYFWKVSALGQCSLPYSYVFSSEDLVRFSVLCTIFSTYIIIISSSKCNNSSISNYISIPCKTDAFINVNSFNHALILFCYYSHLTYFSLFVYSYLFHFFVYSLFSSLRVVITVFLLFPPKYTSNDINLFKRL